jgi:hypothetical protein
VAEDNPFAPPSGDPALPPAPPGAPDWEHPAYQEAWPPSPYERQRHNRLVPRSLVTACHVSAAGAWTFVFCVGLFAAMFRSVEGFVLVMTAGAFVAFLLVAGLVTAVAGLVVAVPLAAIWWGERHERLGDDLGEAVALGHLAIAWAVAAYVIVRIS